MATDMKFKQLWDITLLTTVTDMKLKQLWDLTSLTTDTLNIFLQVHIHRCKKISDTFDYSS